ncbi:MAG: hypothetical protein ACOC80_15320 [Petrotogales bacterium]
MPKKEQFVDIKFQGGLNVDLSPIMLSDEELAKAKNIDIMSRGGFKKRLGTEPFNDSSYDDIVKQIIPFPRDDGSEDILAIIGDEIEEIEGDNSGVSLKIDNDRVPHFFLRDKMFFIDQGNDIFEYDGEHYRKVRPYIYLENVSGAFDIGETVEGEDSEATAVVDVIEDDNLGVSDVSGEFEINEKIEGNDSEATGDIESLDEGVDETNNLEPIKRCKFAYWHSESMRVFFAGDSEDKSAVYYSEYNDPSFVKETSKVYPTRADGPVKGLSVLMDAIIVGYRYSNWIWRGVDPKEDAIWEKLPTSHGPINDDLMTITTNSLTMVSHGGIFAMSPSIIGVPMENEASSDYITNISKDRVNSILKDVNNPEKMRSIFDSDKDLYMVAYCDEDSDRNNKILAFDWELKGFSLYDGLEVNDFCQLRNGDVLLASENYILKMDTGTEDIDTDGDSKTITMEALTSKYNFDMPFQRKKITRIYVIFKNYGPDHELDIKLYIDNSIEYEFTVKGDDSDTEIITHREKTTQVGNNFQLEIINDQYSEVELYGIGFRYTPVRVGGNKV